MKAKDPKFKDLKDFFFSELFIFELVDDRKIIGHIQAIEKNGNILLKEIVEELPAHKVSPLNRRYVSLYNIDNAVKFAVIALNGNSYQFAVQKEGNTRSYPKKHFVWKEVGNGFRFLNNVINLFENKSL